MKELHRVYVTMNYYVLMGNRTLKKKKNSQLMRKPHHDNITCTHFCMLQKIGLSMYISVFSTKVPQLHI